MTDYEGGKQEARDAAHAEIDALKAERDALQPLLAAALYALEYASDMTKPDGLSGCECPICTVAPMLEKALRKDAK